MIILPSHFADANMKSVQRTDMVVPGPSLSPKTKSVVYINSHLWKFHPRSSPAQDYFSCTKCGLGVTSNSMMNAAQAPTSLNRATATEEERRMEILVRVSGVLMHACPGHSVHPLTQSQFDPTIPLGGGVQVSLNARAYSLNNNYITCRGCTTNIWALYNLLASIEGVVPHPSLYSNSTFRIIQARRLLAHQCTYKAWNIQSAQPKHPKTQPDTGVPQASTAEIEACPECKGRGHVELFTSTVPCSRCKGEPK